MPVPRNRADDGYFRPLRSLDIDNTQVFLGLIHYADGVDGSRARLEAASRHLSGFGIATECGFGRRPPEQVPALLRIHRELLDSRGTA
jgi:hypothetical protein